MSHGLQAVKIYKNLDGRTVLNNISFKSKPGKILAIVGHSGSGKTTLLKTINRLIELDSGEILLDGESVSNIDPITLRRRVGMVLQIPTMFDGTVKDNIEFGLRLRESNDWTKKRITQALSDAGLTNKFLNRNAQKLSVGEQQRVALARTLVLEPQVLLLDEPTAALDPKMSRKIEATISQLSKSRKLTILWVTHNHAQARRVGDQIGILKNGSLKLIQKNNSKSQKIRLEKLPRR
jgi:ABC-type phosphate transport system ATPase subunit